MSTSESMSIWDIIDQFKWHWRSLDDFKNMSWFTRVNYVNIFMFVFFVAFAIWQARNKMEQAQEKSPNKRWLPAAEFPDIESLPKFSWKDEEPLKLRTFKPTYYLTMAIQKLDPSELLLMDKNYADRIEYRKKIMKEHHDVAINVNDDKRVGPAIRELYTWLMSTYLPKRYPTMFKLHYASFETGETYMLENLVTKAIFPAKTNKTSNTIMLLENLCQTVDEDFFFLLPEEIEESEGNDAKYRLEACVCVCPSGWNPQEKTGKRLAEIHTPVPGYSKILEGTMDRYFSKVKPGQYIKRSNWTIATNGELFASGSGTNHSYEGDEVEEMQEVDVKNTFLRCERQSLHRLPKSETLVFAFKTYMYPLQDIKDEGLGEDLAQGIDGIKAGNVPAMHSYKRGAVWGEAVKRYLRS